MMRKILLLVLLVSLLTPAQAEWIRMDGGAKQGGAHYFDPGSMQKDGHFRRIWVLSSYDQKQSGGYQSVKSLYELDCKQGKARSYTMLLYSDPKAETSVIGAQHDPSNDWFSYPANSPLSHIAKTVCEK
ncbi:surface-adhesin E family protein [Nitrosomonas sp. Nm34]|uniref:surface-adhesin E family protein n=1 Tax=Nitrosomonas sp. Nm34 TaxID=1881055 RepID=UPI0020C84937|nr:surface-adhesin E family protein [Nitrosomonas sp. Nm34]